MPTENLILTIFKKKYTSIFLCLGVLIIGFIISLLNAILCANQPQRFQPIQYPVIPADYRLYHNGSRFFPIGFYYVDYNRLPKQLLEGQMQALEDIANAGFNVLHASINCNLSAHTTLLKQAERLGVTIISDHQADFARTESLQTFKNSPALLAWSIGDDINRDYQPKEILRVHTQVKAQDPKHATYVSMFAPNPQVIKRYMHVADWIGIQSYPVANRPLDSTFYEINSAVETALSSHGSLIIANLQTFKWQTEREPRPAEIRNMTYQALLAGSQGVLYYTYRDRSWYLPNHPHLWAEMQLMAQELKRLQPWLLDATLQRIELQAYPQVMTGIWQAHERKILVVLNTTRKRQRVSIKLPPSSVHVTSFLNDRPSSFSVKDRVLAASISPEDVQIYQLL